MKENLVLLLSWVVLVINLGLSEHSKNLSHATVGDPNLASVQNEVL